MIDWKAVAKHFQADAQEWFAQYNSIAAEYAKVLWKSEQLEAHLYAEGMRRTEAELVIQDLQYEIESLNNTHIEKESDK